MVMSMIMVIMMVMGTVLFFSLWVGKVDMLDVFALGYPLDWFLAILVQVVQLA